MNEAWDGVSDGANRPCVMSTGYHRRAMTERYGCIDVTAEDRGSMGRTVRVTHHIDGEARDYVMTLRDFRAMLDELERFDAMMRGWRGVTEGEE